MSLFPRMRRPLGAGALIALLLAAIAALMLPPGDRAIADEDTSAADSAAPLQEGWENGGDYPPLGSPKAVRTVTDRPFRIPWLIFPSTLRTEGPESNSIQTRGMQGLQYEVLVGVHPETMEFIPQLASEWKVETDMEAKHHTFTFRINPKARWADGSPVTAEDVYWTWWHRTQEDRNDPMSVMTFKEGYNEPKILDERTIQVTTKELNWRLFLYFGGGMAIYPAKECKNLPGEQYLDEYNWKMWMGSGPYTLDPADVKKGESVLMKRRNDWWAENEPWARNTYNFPAIEFVVILDRELTYEKFKRGELDWFYVSMARRWVTELDKENVIQKGWVKRRKIYNEPPQSYAGLCFNMRKPPFDNRDVRLAFCYLFNREALFEKLFFNEYDFLDSYWPGGDWGNGAKNPKIRYNPDEAERLLYFAGYENRDEEGYLVDANGQRLSVTLEFANQQWQRIWLVVKEYYEQAGIEFNLKLLDGSTLQKKVYEHQFRIHYQGWGGIPFPNPETSWRSDLADKTYNNNLPGFKNKRVDELCEKYNVTFEREEQKKIIREIDSIIFDEHPYALGWTSSFLRVLYWDRFGHPDTYWSRITDVAEEGIMTYWWWDPDRMKALDDAMAKDATLPDYAPIEVRPWAKKD